MIIYVYVRTTHRQTAINNARLFDVLVRLLFCQLGLSSVNDSGIAFVFSLQLRQLGAASSYLCAVF